MLRIVRIIGTTLVAMLAISGVASAHFFEAEKAGSITRVANALQSFHQSEGGLEVACKKDLVLSATAVAGKQLHQLATIGYDECEAVGVGAATVSNAQYLFSADNLVKLENTVVITAPLGCVITIKPQDLTGITYDNSGKGIVILPSVKGISSVGEGGLGLCKATSSNGTYSGSTQVESAGQTIKWA